MRVLQMYPKDITLLCEFSVTDLISLRKAMDLVQINFNAEIPEEVEAKEFLLNNFMSFLDASIQGATDGT